MKIIATMPCRNEDWIVGLSARAALMWVDTLLVLNHASEDRTLEILLEVATEYPGRVIVRNEPDPVWAEMRHRQTLLEMARENGATHIAIVDADEVLSGNLLPTIRDSVAQVPAGATMQLPWQCLRGSIHKAHADGIWGTADVSMAFVDEPRCHWAARNGYDFHHRQPMGRPFFPFRPVARNEGGLMHLQFVSDRRLRAKQYLYQLTERQRWPDREPVAVVRQRYSRAVYEHNVLTDAPASWWAPYQHLMEHLHVDAEPWQVTACARILDERPELAAGLDSFGVTA